MKSSIAWHTDGLRNRQAHLEREEAALERQTRDVERCRGEVAFYRAQIELAKKEGKDGFDPEKYAIKRLCV
jgi:hypothetical protein